jgi:two-component system, NtrC family, response regulator HydG
VVISCRVSSSWDDDPPPPDVGAPDIATLAQPKYVPSKAPAVLYSIAVVQGPDQGLRAAVSVTNPSRILVGQSPVCDVRLTDREASRRHAALEPIGDELRITDLGSTNRTWVNEIPIQEAYLRGGESIRIGASVLVVERHAAGPVASLTTATSFGHVLGASREMRRLYPLCEKLAASNVPVLIEGETGTGKEVLAESLHEMGPRAAGPFIVFDCTAVPLNLVEAELFGHERGAFTGATTTRKGLVEQAQGGTLLIDEIGDLDLALQPKLLRAIERAEVRRVGGDRPIRVDVRILSATRRDLDHEVAAGRFRDDLFHRLAVARIELPPLRRRRGDISLLARAFCTSLGGDDRALPPLLLQRWEDHAWPGNVRELRNAVARYLAIGDLVLTSVDEGRADEEARTLEDILALRLPFVEARERMLEIFRERYVERLLAEHGGNVSKAAAASGIARRHFQRLKARVKRAR